MPPLPKALEARTAGADFAIAAGFRCYTAESGLLHAAIVHSSATTGLTSADRSVK